MSIRRTLLVDIAIFIALLVADSPSLTGTSIHEWLSLALAIVILIHLVLHWNWLVNITRNFFRKSHRKFQLHYIVDGLFFIAFITVMLSGLLMSREILPTLNIEVGRNPSWRQIHSLSADLSIIFLALHFALHWKWIATAVKNVFSRSSTNPAKLSHRITQG